MKKFTKILMAGVITILYGCNVYHSGTASLEEAVKSEDRVRIVTADNVFYDFKQLYRENTKVVGIAGMDSDTSKMLKDRPHTKEGRDFRFSFEESEILAVYLRNKKMSNIISFGVPIVGAAGLVGVTSDNFKPDIGN